VVGDEAGEINPPLETTMNTEIKNVEATENTHVDVEGLKDLKKAELVALAVQAGLDEKSANKHKKAELVLLLTEAFGKPKRKMAETLKHYRIGYAPSVSYSGGKTLNNGDELAQALAGMHPTDVVALAERVLGLDDGELWAKYQNLNPGQQRMNSGNRIRNAIKRGDLTEDEVLAVI